MKPYLNPNANLIESIQPVLQMNDNRVPTNSPGFRLMDSDVPVGPSPSISYAADSVRRWIASLVLYVELRIRLLALESEEAAVHLLVLAGSW